MDNVATTNNTVDLKGKFFEIPFTTRWIGSICVLVYIAGLFYPPYMPQYCLRPSLVVTSFQVWRLFTSPVLHGGIVHLIFNILALLKLGPSLERELFGSLQFLALNILLIISCGFLHCFVDFFAGWVGFEGWNNCSVGYSAVLFALITIHSHLSPNPMRFFGTKVPAAFYPWLLLLSVQIFMPQVSFGGHLSGILAAYCYIFNLTSWLLPTPRLLQKIESSSWSIIDFLVNRPGYIVSPYLGLPSAPSGQNLPHVASNAIQYASSWFTRNNSTTTTPEPQTSSSNNIPQVNTIHTITPPAPPANTNTKSNSNSFTGKAYRLADPPNTKPPAPAPATPIVQPVYVNLPESEKS